MNITPEDKEAIRSHLDETLKNITALHKGDDDVFFEAMFEVLTLTEPYVWAEHSKELSDAQWRAKQAWMSIQKPAQGNHKWENAGPWLYNLMQLAELFA